MSFDDYNPNDSYSDSQPLNPHSARATIQACRNARVIRWLDGLSATPEGLETRAQVTKNLAFYLDCPLDEVTLDGEALDNATLNAIFTMYGSLIERPV